MGAKKALICAFFAALSPPAAAQTATAGNTIDCTFSPKHSIQVKSGQVTETKDTSRDLVITFTSFNPEKSTASLVGNAGSADLFFTVDGGYLFLAQMWGSAIKTFTSMPLPTEGSSVPAVHSRHVWFPGASAGIISQWSGPCRLR